MLTLPQKIDDYLSINIETRYADWAAGTTYNFGDIAFYEHYYYKSVIDGSVGVIPLENPQSWLRWSVSNRYAQIDLQARTSTRCDVDTKTGGLAPFTLISEFQNDRYDAIALGGVHASSILIEILDNLDAVVYTFTEDLSNRRPEVVDWYTYYYTPLPDGSSEFLENFFYRLPLYDLTHKIRVTLEEKSGYSECSYMICGNTTFIGDTLFGFGLGLIDYSSKEVDDFGILELKRRESRQTMDVDVSFDSGRINLVNRAIRDILGSVVLFINDEAADSAYEHLLMLGLVEDFTTVLSNPQKTSASISLTEVI